MCQQAKTGYNMCPHVHSDDKIEACGNAPNAQEEKFCDTILTYWKAIRKPGKCMWCLRHDAEDKNKKTWGRGKCKKRPSWLE